MALFPSIILIMISALACVYLFWKLKYGLPDTTLPAVLAYHKVDGFEISGTWISPARFASQIDSLLDSGFSFIDEDRFLNILEGRIDGEGKEILLTFDDGYRDLLYNAVPILEERSIPALAFVVTSFIGKDNRWELNMPGRRSRHLDWDELRELISMGVRIGSHTCTHRDLTRINLEEARREIAGSRGVLAEKLQAEISCLSYPFGRASLQVREEAEKAGYRAAFSLYPPFSNRKTDRYMLRREGVYVIDTPLSVRNKLPGSRFFWFEDIKGRLINSVSILTPMIKGRGGGGV